MRGKFTSLFIAALVLLGLSAAIPAKAQPAANGAADLRGALTSLLSEHVYLAANATGAALGGREAEFTAAAAALDENSVELSQAIGSVYGPEAEQSFLPLWRAHIGFFVDYTQGVAAQDQAKQDQAVQALLGYVNDAAAFFSSANPNLPKDVVADILKSHVVGLKDVVDAQASGDATAAASALRQSYAHSGEIAGALAGGIAQQFPDKFSGAADSPAADLQTGLRMLLQEHVALAANATGAALGGREAEFTAAAAALDENSVELSQAIGSVYGPEAEQSFLPLWRAHIGFFVDYTQGVAAQDQAKQDQAVQALLGYVNDAAAFFSSANPNLPKDVVANLIKEHVLTLKGVVDAQATGDQAAAYAALRSSYAHMTMIADPLAAAIVQQFPDKFAQSDAPAAGGVGGASQHSAEQATGQQGAQAMLPTTSDGAAIPWVTYLSIIAAAVALGTFLVVRSRRAV